MRENRKVKGFGFCLGLFRRERNLSYRDLAKLANVDHSYLRLVEIGQRKDPSPAVVRRILGALKLTRNQQLVCRALLGKEVEPELIHLFVKDPDRDPARLPVLSAITWRKPETWANRDNALKKFLTANDK